MYPMMLSGIEKRTIFIIFFILWFIGDETRACPNLCSGHGYCEPDAYFQCICFEKYTGSDCSQRICPSGRAWVDYPSSDNVAHAPFTECSNMGICDRTTGLCTCRDGFTGSACQRMACKNSTSVSLEYLECGGRGQCMSMRDAGMQADYVSLFNRGINYDEWDADQIYGCVCDEGFTGFACDQRPCPYGLDPLFDEGDLEIQVIDCTCPSPCQGSLSLTFLGAVTGNIPYSATAEFLKWRLESLSTIKEVSINMTGNTSICGGDTTGTTTAITFMKNYGDLRPITVDTSQLSSEGGAVVVNISTDGDSSMLYPGIRSQKGTKVLYECSNHGICDYDTGSCECHDYFGASDGAGNAGTIPDCGAVQTRQYNNRDTTNGTCPIVTGAWFSDSEVALECAGAGNCTGVNNTCVCDPGYFGPGCERMECDRGHAWFGEAIENSTYLNSSAHSPGLLCSGMGICDFETGECTCETTHELFTGDGCQLLDCYTNDTDYDCSGAGYCITMAEMAQYALDIYGDPANVMYSDPWDADMIQGCHCWRSPSVDNQDVAPGGVALTYRGPFAFADTDYFSYGCEYMRCPTGDNPMTDGQVNEIQRIKCKADFGAFTLSFRNSTTDEIEPFCTASELEAAIEDMLSVRDVIVTFYNGADFMCNASDTANSTIDIEFLTEHGDLPLMTVDASSLYSNTSDQSSVTHPAVFTIEELIRGTKENVECSARGICAEEIGVCVCNPGFNSSDGNNAPGERGDCGYRNPWATAMYFEEGMARLSSLSTSASEN